MSVSTDIMQSHPKFKDVIDTIKVTKTEMYGEKATSVVVNLATGQTVTGTFTTEAKPGFGGVEFSSQKDIAGLMVAKIESVLEGKHDRT